MHDQEQILQQVRLLETHRQTLAHYLEQLAKHSSAYAPPAVTHGIREARAEIRAIKLTLRNWAVPVENLPGDEMPTPEMTTSATERAGAAFAVVEELMRTAHMYADIAGFQVSLETVCRQIDRLSSYKTLHDLLHELQFKCYEPMMRGARHFPSDEFFRESLAQYELDLQELVNNLRDATDQSAFLQHEQTWIQQLDHAGELLRSALQSSNKEQLDRAIFQIERVLRVHPTPINERLKEAARDLPLTSLIDAMAKARDQLAGIDPNLDRLHQISQGIAALEQIRDSLALLIDEHDTWQEIDLELHPLEDRLEQSLHQLEWLWPELKAKVGPLCANNGDRWSQDFQTQLEQLERALLAREAAAVILHFRGLRRRAGWCFFQADKKLKELCRSLRQFDGPLAIVMREVR